MVAKNIAKSRQKSHVFRANHGIPDRGRYTTGGGMGDPLTNPR